MKDVMEIVKYLEESGLLIIKTKIKVKQKKTKWWISSVYCGRLSHAVTCPFSKYFQILKILPFFKIYLLFFWKIAPITVFFRIGSVLGMLLVTLGASLLGNLLQVKD